MFDNVRSRPISARYHTSGESAFHPLTRTQIPTQGDARANFFAWRMARFDPTAEAF